MNSKTAKYLRKIAKTETVDIVWEEYVRDESRDPRKELPVILDPMCGKAYYRHLKTIWTAAK